MENHIRYNEKVESFLKKFKFQKIVNPNTLIQNSIETYKCALRKKSIYNNIKKERSHYFYINLYTYYVGEESITLFKFKSETEKNWDTAESFIRRFTNQYKEYETYSNSDLENMNDLSRAFTNYIVINKLQSSKVIEKTGISGVAISNISAGRYNIKFSTFKKFANSESISPFELLSYAYIDKNLRIILNNISKRVNKHKSHDL